MTLVLLQGHARKIGVAEQAEKVGIGGSGDRGVEQAAGDVHHVSFHQVSFCFPSWVKEYINVGWLHYHRSCTSLLSSTYFVKINTFQVSRLAFVICRCW